MQTLKLGEAASGLGQIQTTPPSPHHDEGEKARSPRPAAGNHSITRLTTLHKAATASVLPRTQPQPKMHQQQLCLLVVSAAHRGQSLSPSVLSENARNYKRHPQGQKAGWRY